MRISKWLVCLFVLLMLGCDRRSSDTSPAADGGMTAVKLILNWKPEPEFGGFFAARDQGIFASHHLDVTIESAPEHVTQLIASGKAEFGIMAADEIAIARGRGIDIVALYAVYQTNPQGIMTHASRHFTNLKDLFQSDGTLAVQPGLAYVDFLKKQYAPVRVKLVPYDYSIVHFMASTDFSQQCFITSEPLAARRQGADAKIFLIADSGFNPYAGVVVTSGEFLKNHRHTVEAFVQATRKGWQTYLTDPDPSNRIMGKLNTQMDAATFAAAAREQMPLIETDETRAHGLGTMTSDRWRTLIGQLVELNQINHPPRPDECFVNP